VVQTRHSRILVQVIPALYGLRFGPSRQPVVEIGLSAFEWTGMISRYPTSHELFRGVPPSRALATIRKQS
jgi:hypothetical protein